MNILVTGANGQLGTHLQLLSEESQHCFMFTDIDTLDITSEPAVCTFFRHNDIDVVINCAAYTNVDAAEDAEQDADRVNHEAPRLLAKYAAIVKAHLIHVSTDYVFGGEQYNTPIVETAATNPTGVYGKTKLSGEEAVKASGCHYTIVRTAWLYSEYGRNFVKTMLMLTASKDELKVVVDQVGTPTYAGDLAKAILHIVDHETSDHNAVYHYSDEGVCSWYDFACAIAELSGHERCMIQPCHSNEFPSKVVRPSYSVLDKTLIKQTLGIAIPNWRTSLRVCIANLAAQEA